MTKYACATESNTVPPVLKRQAAKLHKNPLGAQSEPRTGGSCHLADVICRTGWVDAGLWLAFYLLLCVLSSLLLEVILPSASRIVRNQWVIQLFRDGMSTQGNVQVPRLGTKYRDVVRRPISTLGLVVSAESPRRTIPLNHGESFIRKSTPEENHAIATAELGEL